VKESPEKPSKKQRTSEAASTRQPLPEAKLPQPPKVLVSSMMGVTPTPNVAITPVQKHSTL